MAGLLILGLFIRFPGVAESNDSHQRFTIIVLGDSLGDGLYAGLHNKFRKDKRIKLLRFSKVGSGLFSLNMQSWQAKLERIIDQHQPDVAVVMTGGNDPQPILYDGRKREAFKSEEWRTLYVDRVGEYMQSLVDHNLTTFWVGLPVMRKADYDGDIQLLDKIYQESAAQYGVTFIPTRDLTTDEEGQYNAYRIDSNGRRIRWRANDGMHFTLRGYEILAQVVLETIQEKTPYFEWGADYE